MNIYHISGYKATLSRRTESMHPVHRSTRQETLIVKLVLCLMRHRCPCSQYNYTLSDLYVKQNIFFPGINKKKVTVRFVNSSA